LPHVEQENGVRDDEQNYCKRIGFSTIWGQYRTYGQPSIYIKTLAVVADAKLTQSANIQ